MTHFMRPPGRPVTLARIISCFLLTCAAIGMIIAVYSQAAGWWRMRQYVPVTATLLELELEPSEGARGQVGWPYHLFAVYAYRYGGAHYSSGQLGPALDSVLSMGDQAAYKRLSNGSDDITIWVDPLQPQSCVLERDFGWFRAFLLAGLSMLFMIPLWILMGQARSPSQGRRSHADPGKWPVRCALALQANILMLPMMSVALAVREHFFVYTAVAFLFASFAIGAAFIAHRRWRSESGIGAMTAEMPHVGGSPSKVRVRFGVPFGTRRRGQRNPTSLRCYVRQVECLQSTQGRSWNVIWTSPPETCDVRHGAVTADFHFSPPPWATTAGWEPGYWEVVLWAREVQVTFKLAPGTGT